MTKLYPSKVSYGLLTFVFFIFYGPSALDLIKGNFNQNMIVLLVFLTVFFVFIVHLFYTTHYTIKGNQLHIKCGFFSYKPIAIDEIKEIASTKSIVSAPAPSFDRIEIKYGKFDNIVISPQDKFHFAKDLVAINPRITTKISA